jgi:hypothetical protein
MHRSLFSPFLYANIYKLLPLKHANHITLPLLALSKSGKETIMARHIFKNKLLTKRVK